MDAVAEAQLLQVAQAIEAAVDDELQKIDDMEDDDYNRIREKRLAQLKKMQRQKDLWLARGHGMYEQISDVKEYFEAAKSSERVVVHFGRATTERCATADAHLSNLAKQHFETRFIKVDVEKLPWLAEQFNIMMLPTIQLIEGGKTFHSIIGFDEFGGSDTFPTERVESVLTHYGMLNDKDMFAADQHQED